MASKKSASAEKDHEVMLNLSVIQAVTSARKDPPYYETTRNGKRKRVYEAVRPVHTFHMEYNLTPGQGPTSSFQTDIVTYCIVSKIFTEQDERVVNVWKENGLTYYGWNHKHLLRVNQETLLDLYEHTITIRLWNNVDKLSPRARFDRPKAFRLPAPHKPEVVDESQDSEGMYPNGHRPTHLPNVHHDAIQKKRSRRRRSSQVLESLNDLSPRKAEQDIPMGTSDDSVKEKIGELDEAISEEAGLTNEGAESLLYEELGTDNLSLSARESSLKSVTKREISSQAILSFESLSASVSKFRGLSRKKVRQLQADAMENVRIDREGLIILKLSFADLFTGRTSISASTTQGVRNLKKFEVCLSVTNPLMSEDQRRRLNPAEFLVRELSNLPAEPSTDEVKPMYLKYQFYDKPAVMTPPTQPNESTITWEHRKVLLLGTIRSELLLEYLRGPPLVIEVHNKGRDPMEGVAEGGAVFGSIWSDELLGTCTYTREVKKKSRTKTDLFGVAYLDLGVLLDGLKTTEYCLPILSENINYSGCTMKSHELLKQDVHLSLMVTLSYPLNHFPSIAASKLPLTKLRPLTPFGRIIYIVKSNLIDKLLSIVKEINKKALNLDTLPSESQDVALSTYKLTREDIVSSSCNVLTGFHVDNGDTHFVVCEGLAQNGIVQLWDHTPHHHTQDQGVIKVFYNSEYTFSHRLYGNLDVDLSYVKLPRPLEDIIRQPVIYLHEAIPKLCFNCLMKINELQICPGLSDVIRTDCLPSAMMVTALNLYCMQQEHTNPTVITSDSPSGCSGDNQSRDGKGVSLMDDDDVAMTTRACRRRRRTWEPLDRSNEKYETLLRDREKGTGKNFIQENIASTKLQSNEVSKHRTNQRSSKLFLRSLSDSSHKVHPYSSQTLNSSVVGMELLRRQLNPKERYTHSQLYHYRTIDPPGTMAMEECPDISSQKFVYPVMKNSLEDNAPSKQLHPSRKDELTEPFVDNLLHKNKLEPTVNRRQYKWNERTADFERYKPCPIDFGTKQPATIHLAGDTRDEEYSQSIEEERKQWEHKVIVDDLRFHVLRRNPKTETTTRGAKATTQIEKMKGLLKDKPNRLSLKLSEHLRVDNIPAISTIRMNEDEDSIIGFLPGPDSLRSLKRNANVIPLYQSKETKTDRFNKDLPPNDITVD